MHSQVSDPAFAEASSTKAFRKKIYAAPPFSPPEPGPVGYDTDMVPDQSRSRAGVPMVIWPPQGLGAGSGWA